MLTLLIFFCLIHVLVRVCLGCWGYILKQSFLCSPVSLSWFPQSPTPVSTPNTCIVTGVFLGGCQVSHLPLSFFRCPSYASCSSCSSLTPNAWRQDLCKLVLCHLVSSCVIVQTCSHVVVIFVMACDGVDFEHSCLPFVFSPATLGAQNPTTAKGCWVRGRNGLRRKVCPSSLVVGSAALSWPLRGMSLSKAGWLVPSKGGASAQKIRRTSKGSS